jgi:hypothetical protein
LRATSAHALVHAVAALTTVRGIAARSACRATIAVQAQHLGWVVGTRALRIQAAMNERLEILVRLAVDPALRQDNGFAGPDFVAMVCSIGSSRIALGLQLAVHD